MGEGLSSGEVAARLGVKLDTVYAYVSRGLLARRTGPNGRSTFDVMDVERLAARGRGPGAAKAARPARRPVVVASSITALTGNGFTYRGHDVAGLCATHTFEQVAELLWDPTTAFVPVSLADGRRHRPRDCAAVQADPSGAADAPAWAAPAEALALARAVSTTLRAGTRPFDRLRVIVAAVGASDELRSETSPAAVTTVGRTLIATLVEALAPLSGASIAPSVPARLSGGPTRGRRPAARGGEEPGTARRHRHHLAADPGSSAPRAGSVAGRLAWALRAGREGRKGRREADDIVALVDDALVLGADQGLVPSTVAARVAASVQADPYSVVVAGLGAIAGRLHGAACLGAEELLDEVERTGSAAVAIGARLRRGERIPGFGEGNYPDGDPRAVILLDRLATSSVGDGDGDAVARAVAVVEVMGSRGLPKPNIDFALAALTHAAGLVPGASEALIAIARCAGWLAHALEEYAHPSRFELAVVPSPPQG